jgi:hypothetical protein
MQDTAFILDKAFCTKKKASPGNEEAFRKSMILV